MNILYILTNLDTSPPAPVISLLHKIEINAPWGRRVNKLGRQAGGRQKDRKTETVEVEGMQVQGQAADSQRAAEGSRWIGKLLAKSFKNVIGTQTWNTPSQAFLSYEAKRGFRDFYVPSLTTRKSS